MRSRLRRLSGMKGRLFTAAGLAAVLAAGVLVACLGATPVAHASSARAQAHAALPPIKHVWVIVEENESASTTFGASSPAPYLSKTLPSEGAYLPNYYGVGHSSLDNYIAMVSGQAPNTDTSADCGTFANFPGDSMDANGQENSGEGCVYPTDVPTLMTQLTNAGLNWKAYEDGMPSSCVHPAIGGSDANNGEEAGEYATRHNPFVYFHSVIDNASQCNAEDVPFSQLSTDLSSAATTPNYSFITPNVCDDGHDATCADGGPGGLPQADTFLKTVIPEITSSPAYQQNGLIMIIFDEAASSDASACCGEVPGPEEGSPGGTGPGGGDTGAVLLSPYIAPGTVSNTAYNHYTMLGSVENIFGLSHIGYANLSGETYFGSDIFTQPNGPAPATTTTTATTPSATTTTTAPVLTKPSVTPKPVAPRDSALKLSPAAFIPTGIAGKKQHHGTTLIYTASQAGTTTISVERSVAGYKLGKAACRALKAGRKRPAKAKACTLVQALGTLSHRDKVGVNRVAFTGRLKGRALAKGRYVLAIRPKAGKLTGKIVTVRFTVI